MSVQITVTLPDEIYQRAKRVVELNKLDVDAVIAEVLDLSFSPLSPYSPINTVESLSDAEIIALAESKMDAAQSARMSSLLAKQQAESITQGEQTELQSLMRVYDAGQLRKAQAMVEATKRELQLALNHEHL